MFLLASIKRVYGWYSASVLAQLYGDSGHDPFTYLANYWSVRDMAAADQADNLEALSLANWLRLAMGLQLAGGLAVMAWAVYYWQPDWFLYGIAIAVSYPLVWSHLLFLAGLIAWLVGLPIRGLKNAGKSILCEILESQVVELRARRKFNLVAVAGSVGKTSTKLAVAQLLASAQRVRWQDGNYNDRLTVPLTVFGRTEPGLFNIPAWLMILIKNEWTIARPFNFDTVVVEIGTDGPGQMQKFAYLEPDLTILTAVQPEHMEQFGTLRAVADEELTVLDYSRRALVNSEDVASEFLKGRDCLTYGSKGANYALSSLKALRRPFGQQKVSFNLSGRRFAAKINYLGNQGAKICLAAAAAACELAMPVDDIRQGLSLLQPPAGRMNLLKGLKNSYIIDDTYNSSPSAAAAALEVLQTADAKQRVAILGSMNELGETSRQAHEQVGQLCDPAKLDLVVTIGAEANDYLASEAKKAGCETYCFADAAQAGKFVAGRLKSRALVLVKGSQNGVFAEEAVKQLLANPADAGKLVRQSPAWLRRKRKSAAA